MIVTNEFVMLNFPKTGSSFARTAIKRAYTRRISRFRRMLELLHVFQPSVKEVLLPKIDEKVHHNIKDQHGTLRQIPAYHKDKPILSITRNPIARYESLYKFRWWEKYPPADITVIREKYPHFPDLSFSEYYEMIHDFGKQNRLSGIRPNIDLGIHTIQFIQFYFEDPESVLRRIDEEYIDNEQYLEDMGAIRFIHQESLRSELKAFLRENGFRENDLAFIESMERINVTDETQVSSNRKELSIDDGVRNRIIKRDGLLFKLFPEYLPIK